MVVASIRLLAAAEADFEQAYARYNGRSRQAAAGFEAAMEVALQCISESPDRWPTLDKRHRFYILRKYPL